MHVDYFSLLCTKACVFKRRKKKDPFEVLEAKKELFTPLDWMLDRIVAWLLTMEIFCPHSLACLNSFNGLLLTCSNRKRPKRMINNRIPGAPSNLGIVQVRRLWNILRLASEKKKSCQHSLLFYPNENVSPTSITIVVSTLTMLCLGCSREINPLVVVTLIHVDNIIKDLIYHGHCKWRKFWGKMDQSRKSRVFPDSLWCCVVGLPNWRQIQKHR